VNLVAGEQSQPSAPNIGPGQDTTAQDISVREHRLSYLLRVVPADPAGVVVHWLSDRGWSQRKTDWLHSLVASDGRSTSPTSVAGLIALLADRGVTVAGGAPPDEEDVIVIYEQPLPLQPSQVAPIAILGVGPDSLLLWPVGSPEQHIDAWRHLVEECRMYFSPEWDQATNWAYACYHTGTVANHVSRTYWTRRCSAPPDTRP